MGTPRLLATNTPASPDALVIVLHGGGARRGSVMVSPAQLSVLRMIPVAWRIARTDRRRLAVFRLLNSARGWDTSRTPVDDALWAIAKATRRYPGVPVVLVGHSLGGRAALLAGAAPQVSTVVALNAFVFPSDMVDLTGRRVMFIHGQRDRIALPARSAAVARRLGALTQVGYITVRDARHAMLRRGSVFEQVAADFIAVTVLHEVPATRAMRRLAAGSTKVEI